MLGPYASATLFAYATHALLKMNGNAIVNDGHDINHKIPVPLKIFRIRIDPILIPKVEHEINRFICVHSAKRQQIRHNGIPVRNPCLFIVSQTNEKPDNMQPVLGRSIGELLIYQPFGREIDRQSVQQGKHTSIAFGFSLSFYSCVLSLDFINAHIPFTPGIEDYMNQLADPPSNAYSAFFLSRIAKYDSTIVTTHATV